MNYLYWFLVPMQWQLCGHDRTYTNSHWTTQDRGSTARKRNIWIDPQCPVSIKFQVRLNNKQKTRHQNNQLTPNITTLRQQHDGWSTINPGGLITNYVVFSSFQFLRESFSISVSWVLRSHPSWYLPGDAWLPSRYPDTLGEFGRTSCWGCE